MSNNRKNDNLGDQILHVVDEILESGEFQKLNSVVSETVSMALDEARKQLEKASEKAAVTKSSTAKTAAATKSPVAKTAVSKTAPTGRFSSIEAEPRTMPTYSLAKPPKVKLKKVGSVSSVLLQVFGGIGTVVFGLLFLISVLTNIGDGKYWDVTAIMSVLLAFCSILVYFGVSRRARLKRAERYIQVMQGKSYINISELALLTNKSESYVRKDVRKMIESGIFPEGHLDMQEACLIIGDVAYREYLRMEKSRMAVQAELEEQKRLAALNVQKEAERVAVEKVQNAVGEENAELNAMIREGNECIRQLRDLNDAIEGEVISAKLFHLENLLKEIFEQVKEHPEQMPEMHKFMEYYLPTTLKLVTAYEEFDRVSVPGEDILASKKEIEKTLDTINMAFEELLNKLFRSRVYDVTADAQVLKTMLEREGLTREPVFASRASVEEPDTMKKELK